MKSEKFAEFPFRKPHAIKNYAESQKPLVNKIFGGH